MNITCKEESIISFLLIFLNNSYPFTIIKVCDEQRLEQHFAERVRIVLYAHANTTPRALIARNLVNLLESNVFTPQRWLFITTTVEKKISEFENKKKKRIIS